MRSQDWIWIQLPRAVQLGQYNFLLHSKSCLVWSRRTASVVSHSNFHQRRKLAAYQYCKKLKNFWGLEGKDLVSVVLLFVCFLFQPVTAGSSQLYNSPTTKFESISNAGGISRETQFKRKKCCTSMWSGGKQGVRNSPAPGQSRRGRRCSRHHSRDCWAAHGEAHTGAGEKCKEEGTAERNCDGLNTSPYSPSFPVILRAGEEAKESGVKEWTLAWEVVRKQEGVSGFVFVFHHPSLVTIH